MSHKIDRRETERLRYKLRLFVSGDAPNSRIARENLQRLQRRLDDAVITVEIVDVMQEPRKALGNGIFLTPALQVLGPEPGAVIYGNLNDADTLLALFPGAQQ